VYVSMSVVIQSFLAAKSNKGYFYYLALNQTPAHAARPQTLDSASRDVPVYTQIFLVHNVPIASERYGQAELTWVAGR